MGSYVRVLDITHSSLQPLVHHPFSLDQFDIAFTNIILYFCLLLALYCLEYGLVDSTKLDIVVPQV